MIAEKCNVKELNSPGHIDGGVWPVGKQRENQKGMRCGIFGCTAARVYEYNNSQFVQWCMLYGLR